MDTYRPLHDWLRRQPSDRVELLFDEIEDEDTIGVKLPRTAREKRTWWGNEFSPKTRHYQCRAWTEAGWQVESVNLSSERVVFVRARK
jgi:hypothetical protein